MFFIVPIIPIRVHVECINGTKNTFIINGTREIAVDRGCKYRNEDFEYVIENEETDNITVQFSQNLPYDFDSSVDVKITTLANNTILLDELDSEFNNLTRQLLALYQQASRVPEKINVSQREENLIEVILWACLVFVMVKIARAAFRFKKNVI